MTENVDLVRSIFAACERGDFGSAEWAGPDIEFVVAADGPTADTQRGVTAMGQGFGRFLSAWDRYSVKADEYRELDGGRVHVILHGSGKASGLELGLMRTTGSTLFHVRGDKVTKLVIYPEGAPSLADLGPAE